MTTSSDKYWTAGGVMGWQSRPLSDEEKRCILELAGASGHESKAEFIGKIEFLISSFLTAKSFYKGNTKKIVKAEINGLIKTAKLLTKRLDTLSEYTNQLLSEQGRGPDWGKHGVREVDGKLHVGAMPDGTAILDIQKGFTVEEAYAAIRQLTDHAQAVLKFTALFKSTRPPDYAKHQLAIDCAKAFRDILGKDPVTSAKETYENTLREILWCAGESLKKGIDKDDRDVTDLVQLALDELSAMD